MNWSFPREKSITIRYVNPSYNKRILKVIINEKMQLNKDETCGFISVCFICDCTITFVTKNLNTTHQCVSIGIITDTVFLFLFFFFASNLFSNLTTIFPVTPDRATASHFVELRRQWSDRCRVLFFATVTPGADIQTYIYKGQFIKQNKKYPTYKQEERIFLFFHKLYKLVMTRRLKYKTQ